MTDGIAIGAVDWRSLLLYWVDIDLCHIRALCSADFD